MPATPVGMIGLGIMGSAMAANLVKAGFEVFGYDKLAACRAAFKRAGGRPAAKRPGGRPERAHRRHVAALGRSAGGGLR